MKVIIVKNKNKKISYKYMSNNGLVFDNKKHCEFYEGKWMPKEFIKK
jgi:hypothetical protein